jgi:hypothetical protein
LYDIATVPLGVALDGLTLLLQGHALLALFYCGYTNVSKVTIHK